ncbi:MAG: MBL fold metallo-hydrolase [Chloroflexi bacterium]|nr:MBL fold metallo-hydrolase [Chloroflexota bacterium]
MKVVSLASGSSGNSLLVRCGETTVLVDCGLPARSMEAGLASFRVNPRSVDAILITHEHSDHIRSAGVMSRRYGIPLVVNSLTMETARDYLGRVDWREHTTGNSRTIGEAEVASFPVPHDATSTVGYVIAHRGHVLCVVTDVGTITNEVLSAVENADLVVLEANHDVDMLKNGPYPAFLKKRILSDRGHLSNESAAQAVCSLDRIKQRWVWLAHLSETNNAPSLARKSVVAALDQYGIANVCVEVAKRDRPSLAWDSDLAYCQLALPGASPQSQEPQLGRR